MNECSLCGGLSQELSWFNGEHNDIALCPDCLTQFEYMVKSSP